MTTENQTGKFAHLYAQFEDSDDDDSLNEDLIDATNETNKQIYTNLTNSLIGSSPEGDGKNNSSSSRKRATISLTKENLDDFDENQLIYTSEIPTLENIEKESLFSTRGDDLTKNWSPNSKFKNLNEIMNVLLLKDDAHYNEQSDIEEEEGENKNEEIRKIEEELRNLETSSKSDIIEKVKDSMVTDNENSYNNIKTMNESKIQKIVSDVISNLVKQNNPLANLSYCLPGGKSKNINDNNNTIEDHRVIKKLLLLLYTIIIIIIYKYIIFLYCKI